MNTKTTDIETLTELENLAAEIRDLSQRTYSAYASAKQKMANTLIEARLCGQSLRKAKELVPHGEWRDWIKRNCGGMSFDTVQDYMTLAKTELVPFLENAGSVKQAIRLAQLTKRAEKEQKATEVTREFLKIKSEQTPHQKAPSRVVDKSDVPTINSWERKPIDPVPVIRGVVSDLLALLKGVPKAKAARLLAPLAPWLGKWKGGK
jgi:hypothetical protein